MPPPYTPQLSTANIVALVARAADRYGDSALPTTAENFVVVPADNAATQQDKQKLVDDAIKTRRSFEASSSGSVPSRVLAAMSDTREPRGADTHSDPSLGVVTLAASSITSRVPGADDKTSTAIATIHELGHLNLGQFDSQPNGARDPASPAGTSGWERAMPADVLNTVRSITDQDSPRNAVRMLHAMTHEAYADSFAILSIAAKDGAARGSELAGLLSTHRADEAKEWGTKLDAHDSARGLSRLSDYLKSESGQRLVTTLASKSERQGDRAEAIHQTALKFSTINVRDYATSRGATREQAQAVADWVTANYRSTEASFNATHKNDPTAVSSRKPEVFAYTSETISALATRKDASSAPKSSGDAPAPERVMERTMERRP